MQSADKERLTLHEAAKYFGSSPRLLLRLKRWGWLKSWEHKTRKRAKTSDMHFERSAIDQLAFDYMMSMSIYDIIFVRMNRRDPIEKIAANRGIPLLVANLIQDSEIAWSMCQIARMRCRQADKDAFDLNALSKRMRELVDTTEAQRRERLLKPEARYWKNGGLPTVDCETHFNNMYGKKRTADQFGAGRAHERKRRSL